MLLEGEAVAHRTTGCTNEKKTVLLLKRRAEKNVEESAGYDRHASDDAPLTHPTVHKHAADHRCRAYICARAACACAPRAKYESMTRACAYAAWNSRYRERAALTKRSEARVRAATRRTCGPVRRRSDTTMAARSCARFSDRGDRRARNDECHATQSRELPRTRRDRDVLWP